VNSPAGLSPIYLQFQGSTLITTSEGRGRGWVRTLQRRRTNNAGCSSSQHPHPIYHLASRAYPFFTRSFSLLLTFTTTQLSYRSLEHLFSPPAGEHARGTCLHQTLIKQVCSWHSRTDPVCDWEQLFDRRCADLSPLVRDILLLLQTIFRPSYCY
jgi:hypothetical protein